MDRNYARYRYTTKMVRDGQEGFAAVELHRALSGAPADSEKRVARVVFWDAEGQFSIETFGEDVPLDIAEDLIAEAKAQVRVR
jgi:hypothetical protein